MANAIAIPLLLCLEKQLQKKMLHFACRHHIYELILRAVIDIYWPETTGPDMPTFKQFQRQWQNINQSEYSIGLEDELISQLLNDDKQKILNFV